MTRIITAIAAGLLFVGASGCGTDDDADRDTVVETTDVPAGDEQVDPAGAACPVGDADCYETGAETPGDQDGDEQVDPAGAACPVADADCYETGAEAPVEAPDTEQSGAMCAPGVTECVDTAAP